MEPAEGKNEACHRTFEKEIQEGDIEDKKSIIYDELFCVDYTSDPNRLMIEFPFTFYHWKLEEIIKNFITVADGLCGKEVQDTPLASLSSKTL